ncbi:hypothetical protein CEXT_461311, partial [Caerostris extrusa]
NDSGTNNIANPYRNKDHPFVFRKDKTRTNRSCLRRFFSFPSPQLLHASKFEMSPLILRESDQKIDRATRKKKYETARMDEEESSVQHTGHWKKEEKGCWEIDGKMAAGQRTRWPSRNILECMVIIQFCRWK